MQNPSPLPLPLPARPRARAALSLATGLIACLAAAAHAAETPAAPPLPKDPPEPVVQEIQLEDDSVRIEELRVRGQTVSAKVKPKGKAPEYEILLGEPGRDLSPGAGTAKAGAGQRVWRLFSF
ncbi:hypothetical protein [Roseateles flavus]|uniref:DUF2782 domain-containing protein n=1 Tax=Roseateles flavus TaxID=3149041 RepID=A0ABV0GB54_9BURK